MSDKYKTYAVYHLADAGYSATKISKELDIPPKEVKEILTNRTNNNQNDAIKTTSAPVNSKELMITETSAKGNKSVAIMTKAASEVNDAFRKNMNSNGSRTTKNAIYRPNK